MQRTARPTSDIRASSAGALCTAILAATVLFPIGATAEEAKGRSSVQAAAVTSARITKEQATQAALLALPGDVTDVTIERKRGKMVYVIEIVAKADGAETDVLVDMDTGKVLGMDK
jgi:uncharacterized membrane protein YkoI